MVRFNKIIKYFYYELNEEELGYKQLVSNLTNMLLKIYKQELRDQGFLNED